jgi:hypothetical protein
MYPAKKRLDRRQGDLDDLAGNQPMRLAVNALGRFGVRRVHQAKRGPTPLVEPVGQELDAVLILNLQILAMRLGDVCGRGS